MNSTLIAVALGFFVVGFFLGGAVTNHLNSSADSKPPVNPDQSPK